MGYTTCQERALVGKALKLDAETVSGMLSGLKLTPYAKEAEMSDEQVYIGVEKALTKYFGVTLIPLLAAYALVRTRRLGASRCCGAFCASATRCSTSRTVQPSLAALRARSIC